MHLKSLVLKGFKSFADRSVMTFEPGITVIVGPNGSGKSNVSDAVLWVLGERNARNLRGQAMEDVIFSGSSARKATGLAEVDLVLDNSDNTLPVEFSEVVLSRRMYRNGESEYLINGTQARRMDVLDILHDSGLGTGTHSIISQGHLSSILQSKPEDRRALIEEAAGVLKHKQRKEKSERKLALMDGHLQRVQDVVAEVERQVKPLERKAKRAIAYQDASAELAGLELDLAVDDLRVLQAKWDVVCDQEREADQASTAARDRIQAAEQASKGLQEQLRVFAEDAGDIARKYRRAQAAVDKMESNVLLLHEKKRSATSYVAEMQISLESDSRAVEAALAQKEAASRTYDEVREAGEKAAQAMAQAQQKSDEARTRQRQLQAEIDRLTHVRRSASSQLEDARARLAKIREVVAANRAQDQMIDSHAADLDQRLQAVSMADQQAQESEATCNAALAEAQSAEAEAREAIGMALRARDEARSAADAAREERAAQGATAHSLEELQRARRARNPLLSWTMDHVQELHLQVKPLVERVSAPSNLEAVVEELLGEDVAALFVEDEGAALAIAQRLACVNEAGAVTLLPERSAHDQRSASDGARRLVDQLTCDDQVVDAVERLLGDVFLFDDVASAQAFAQRNPDACCATETGFVVWPNGKVRCRRRGAREEGELAARRALEEARSRLREAQQAEAQAQEAASQAEERLRQAQERGLELSSQVAQLRGQAQAATRERQRSAKALASLQAEAKQLQARKQQTADALAKAEPDAAALASQVADLGDEIDRCRESLDAKRTELAPQRALADQAASDLAEAKLQHATCVERSAYAKRMLEACERDIVSAQQKMEHARQSMVCKRAVLSRIDPLAQTFATLIEQAKLRADGLEHQTVQSQDATAGLHAQINQVREETQAAHGQYDAVSQQLADVRVQKSRIEMQVEAAIETITVGCKTPLEAAVQLPALENRSHVEEQAGKLRRRIANMGTINPDAASEYEELKVRYDYLSSQLNDMLAARRSLNQIMRVIDVRMKDDFANTFDQVNSNFKKIFAELFPGGAGELTLTDPTDMEDTGVEVSAQPPGKRILKMSLMSGGEKSLTALALLFAVYKTRATPFYILDEVEAALDDTNLRRLVGYLGTMRHDSQFIIITHQRRTMEMADVLYGISMHADGVTQVMSQRLEKALQYAEG